MTSSPPPVLILVGDVLDRLRQLPDESVHCVVTSPPYWGLRDYGVPGQIGMEPTYQEHIRVIVDVFREIRRVLRRDGTCWLNYGDCWAGDVNGRPAALVEGDDRTFRDKPFSTVGGALKPKDAALMPHRIAIALQEDGWWVRSDIVWHKSNPMPSSVKDRPTPSKEYVFLLTRHAGRPLFWWHRDGMGSRKAPPADFRWVDRLTDAETTEAPEGWRTERAEIDGAMTKRWKRVNLWTADDYYYDAEGVAEPAVSVTAPTPAGWDTEAGAHGTVHRTGRRVVAKHTFRREHHKHMDGTGQKAQFRADRPHTPARATRNRRDVWIIATRSFKDAHFATFPPALVEPCIAAGTSAHGVCPHCGAPWVRVMDRRFIPQPDAPRSAGRTDDQTDASTRWAGSQRGLVAKSTAGWSPSCGCPDNTPVPARVLDPFGGAGTVGLVAAQLGRTATLIELSPDYALLAVRRIRAVGQGARIIAAAAAPRHGDPAVIGAETSLGPRHALGGCL